MNRKHWWIGITAPAILGAIGFSYIGVVVFIIGGVIPLA